MLALRKTAPAAGLELVDAPTPADPGPGEVMVQVTAVGVCGSDLHAFEWGPNYDFMRPYLPLTMGHEFAGRIAAVGPNVNLRVGQRVIVIPVVNCGRCLSCRTGEERDCTEGTYLGFTRNGAFARFVPVPAVNCIPVPDQVDDEVAALSEPLTIGAEATIVGEIGIGHSVVIMGAGTIGQAAALMARRAGAARVVVVGRADAPRLATLRKLGFSNLIDVADQPLQQAIKPYAQEAPIDRVIEATSSPSSIADGLSILRNGGILVAAGIHSSSVSFPFASFVRARLQLRATYRSSNTTWRRVIAAVSADPEGFRPMITHRLPLASALEAFELAKNRIASKVLLMP